jgi:hypothetical protein
MGVQGGSAQVHKADDKALRMIATNSNRRQRFPLGRIVATPAALEALAKSGDSGHGLIMRHVTGDFGTVCKADWQANEDAIATGERVFSAYALCDGEKVWVITEQDRSVTTLLVPEDY